MNTPTDPAASTPTPWMLHDGTDDNDGEPTLHIGTVPAFVGQTPMHVAKIMSWGTCGPCETGRANAALIVSAVNQHAALVAERDALQATIRADREHHKREQASAAVAHHNEATKARAAEAERDRLLAEKAELVAFVSRIADPAASIVTADPHSVSLSAVMKLLQASNAQVDRLQVENEQLRAVLKRVPDLIAIGDDAKDVLSRWPQTELARKLDVLK